MSKSLNLDGDEKYNEILRIKKDMRQNMRLSCYFIDDSKSVTERYSEKVAQLKKEAVESWQPGRCLVISRKLRKLIK